MSKQPTEMDNGEHLELIPCPLCGNTKLQRISENGQFGLPCHVVICPFDGLVFLSPRWTKEDYAYFYKYEYDNFYRNNKHDKKELYKDAKEIYSRLNERQLIGDVKSILDIGAGMGWGLEWFSNHLSQLNRFAAIEIAECCVENLKSIGIDVISDNVESYWKADGFDIVIMRHVLEHTMNPIKALAMVGRNLSDDGVVYIDVPNAMSPPRGVRESDFFRAVHTFYFSESTLTSMALLAGLQLVKNVYHEYNLVCIFKKAKNIKANKSDVCEEQIKVLTSMISKQKVDK